MAVVDWMHLCDHAFLDEYGKPSVIGIFRYLVSNKLPHIMPHAMIAYNLMGEADEPITPRLSIVTPSNASLVEMRLDPITLPPSREQVGFVLMDGLELHEAGIYVVTLWISQVVSRSIPFVLFVNNHEG